jgi:hypothetical protein
LISDGCARKRSGARIGLRYLLCGLGLLLALLSTSCGNSVFTPGTPVVTLTAKPGRFTSYIVYIDQIYFTRQDGSIAELPAITQHADLAHLSDKNSIYTLSPIEVGTYVSATVELNYSGSYITLDNNGTSVLVSPIDPATSASAGVISVTMKFDPNHPLVVSNQNSTPVAINIDLEASNMASVSSDGTTWQALVKPFWTATTTPGYENKPVYARGLYVTTDAKNNNFVMNVRPLHDVINSPFGALTVNVGAQTYFQINGTTYVGSAGLSALSALQNIYANIQIAAVGAPSTTPFGNLSTIQPSMTATAVYVGTSLESTLEDQVSGFVSAVSGNQVVVQGAAYVDHLGDFGFSQSIPVTLGPNTVISVDGQPNVTPTISSISVGQFITVLGAATSNAYATGVYNPTALDATGSAIPGAQVRLQNSTFYGTLNSLSTGSMSVNMQYIDNYQPTQVKFTGTGAGGADASPSNYIVNTGSLDTTALSAAGAGTILRVDGMPTAFGSGPPYFTASAITPASQLDAELILQWAGTGSASPFSSATASGLVVNLADSSLQGGGSALIRVGPIDTLNLLTQPPTQLVIAFNTGNAAEPPLYGVGSAAAGEALFSDPAGFAGQITSAVNNTNPALKLVATGQYDATTGTFTATSVRLNVK